MLKNLFLIVLTLYFNGILSVQNNTQDPYPNIVLIMADDMGYGDLKYFGNNGDIKTPNIDSLTLGGLKFTNFHSNGVICSPTRASLMTGLYPQEAGIEGVVGVRDHRETGMSPDKYTIAEFLKEAGYRTGIFGKWHLGYQPEFGPLAQGFDTFRGFVSGNIDYHSHIDGAGYPDWWKDKKLKPEKGYLTELITDHGIEFMKNVQDVPFFLYLSHGSPHWPYQGPDDMADRSPHGDFHHLGSRVDRDNAYVEMIESLDENIGRVMVYLSKNNLLENTLIIFLSDNGATPNVGSNKPFRGAKSQVYEGGHRVPAAFYWKGVIQPDVTDELALTMDIFPTIAELLNVDLTEKTEVSGNSFAHLIHGNQKAHTNGDERTVFWRYQNQKAALQGNWKLAVIDDEEALYNLYDDIGETTDVKHSNTDIFKELKMKLDEWEAGLSNDIIF